MPTRIQAGICPSWTDGQRLWRGHNTSQRTNNRQRQKQKTRSRHEQQTKHPAGPMVRCGGSETWIVRPQYRAYNSERQSIDAMRMQSTIAKGSRFAKLPLEGATSIQIHYQKLKSKTKYKPKISVFSTYLRHLNVSVLCERASSRPASKGALGLAWSEHEVLPNCVSEFSA